MSKKILEYSSYIANAIIITLLVVIIGKNNEIRKVKEDYFVEQVVKYKRLAYDRYNYASDLEEICEKYFSSSVEKENYHIRKAQEEFAKGYND
jgi:hypothetical protein